MKMRTGILSRLKFQTSPYTFINEEIHKQISEKANAAEVREIASSHISVNGVLGKRPVKVISKSHCILTFLDPELQRIPVWTTVRVIRGFNTPIREVLDVYDTKLGFGRRKELTFYKPG